MLARYDGIVCGRPWMEDEHGREGGKTAGRTVTAWEMASGTRG